MEFRSSAAHQPSASLAIVIPPHLSISIKRLGTPVSLINNTSRRQQQASQFEQLISFSGGVIISWVINNVLCLLTPCWKTTAVAHALINVAALKIAQKCSCAPCTHRFFCFVLGYAPYIFQQAVKACLRRVIYLTGFATQIEEGLQAMVWNFICREVREQPSYQSFWFWIFSTSC